MRRMRRGALLVAGLSQLLGCYGYRSSKGGGMTHAPPVRPIQPDDVAVAPGYAIEAVAAGLAFPTSVTFDGEGRPHVVESGYSYGEIFTEARLVRLEADGRLTEVARGKNGPWTGAAWSNGAFYIAEGGAVDGGRILRVTSDGRARVLVDHLPSLGDHHTNGPAVGPDGQVYFSVGTATNSAIVGEDNHRLGWLARHPEFHDVPCKDVTLTGANFRSANPFVPDGDRVFTGAYLPFGTPSRKGQVVRGQVPCSGAVLRIGAGGGRVELVAWGFRNPFGLAFAPDGRLFVTDNGYDVRGSRPVFGAADWLWEVRPGAWYGWPDYADGRTVAQDRYTAPSKRKPDQLLSVAPGLPQKPAAFFACHSSSTGLDFSHNPNFGHVGEAFVAQFGDMTPDVGKVLGPVGFKVVRVDVRTGVMEEFAVNRGKRNGPASLLRSGGLERPISARFDPSGESLYVVDYGVMTMSAHGAAPRRNSGVLWRIHRRPR